MEKFPKGEMGWVNKSTVKEYIDRNYVPKEKYNKVCDFFNLLADHIINGENGEALFEIAIKADISKKDCLNFFLDNEDLYEETLDKLIAEGEILPDEEADEE